MDLSEIISITGQNGLFKVVARHKNRMIVESLVDGKRLPAYAHQRITTLEDISIYTTEEDISLKDVFSKIKEKENGGACPESKSDADTLKSYFAGVLPNYDKERVYISDIKKVVGWYNILRTTDLLEEKPEEDKEKEGEEKKPAKATKAAKKPAATQDKPKKAAPASKASSTKKAAPKKASAPKTKGSKEK
ncbi:MAG: DUF5606 domain-containing protein [Flavobacteriales bacterium]|nr:DUF5606 domain-containing protein [Flavobacteriales bacterium]MCB9447597.1 DUF5606 domain-containing protein [Flavobacteriales bacterium]